MIQQKCLTATCKDVAGHDAYRGLCAKCYSAAKKLVESKQTTWEELENLGLCADKTDAFTAEFLKRKKS